MRVPPRGRAIVRRLPAWSEGRTFRPGDFVLTHSRGAIARLLGLATGGELNHAALIVDASGGLVEANPCVMSGEGALRRAHITDYLAAGEPCWVGYVELQEGTRQSVADFAIRLLNSQDRFSELGVVMLALQTLLSIAPRARTARHPWLRLLHPFFDRHALVLREEHTFLSGELVARALERGGFLWDRDPAHVTPAELHVRFHQHEESEGGMLVPLDLTRWARSERSVDRLVSRPAQVSRLVPRSGRVVPTRAAVLRAEDPQPLEASSADGARALVQVMLLAFGGLTVVHGLEMLLRPARR